MSADYSERVRKLFFAPVHAGVADGPVAGAARGGQQVELSASLRAGSLAALRFRVLGCPYLVAAAEAFCDEFEGRTCSDLRQFRVQDTLERLQVPVEKTGRILLLEEAIHALAAHCGGAQPDN